MRRHDNEARSERAERRVGRLLPYVSVALPTLMLVGLVAVAVASSVNTPHTFVPNTVASAGQVNANFQAHEAAIDDNDARIDALESDVDLLFSEVEIVFRTSFGSAATLLTLDGAPAGPGNVIQLDGTGTYQLEADVVGRRTDAVADGSFKVMTFAETVAGSVSFVALPELVHAVADDGTWNVDIVPSNGGVAVQVNGGVGQTVNWVARVRILGVGD